MTTYWEATWSALPWLMEKLSNLHSGRNVVCMNESQLTGRLAYTWHLTILPYKSLTKTIVRIKVYKESHERVFRKEKWPSLTVGLHVSSLEILTYCPIPRIWLQRAVKFFLFSISINIFLMYQLFKPILLKNILSQLQQTQLTLSNSSFCLTTAPKPTSIQLTHKRLWKTSTDSHWNSWTQGFSSVFYKQLIHCQNWLMCEQQI